jgi:hypothetical protein
LAHARLGSQVMYDIDALHRTGNCCSVSNIRSNNFTIENTEIGLIAMNLGQETIKNPYRVPTLRQSASQMTTNETGATSYQYPHGHSYFSKCNRIDCNIGG